MPYRIFTVPIAQPDGAIQELNQFLATHQVVEVDRQFCPNDGQPFWTFCINYATGSGNPLISRAGTGKVDYKEVLNEDDFAVFARLRELRKQIAEEMSVPVFAVLTNAQLAEMAKRRVSSLADLRQIAGIGDKKAESFGNRFLKNIAAVTPSDSPADAETGNSTGELFPGEL